MTLGEFKRYLSPQEFLFFKYNLGASKFSVEEHVSTSEDLYYVISTAFVWATATYPRGLSSDDKHTFWQEIAQRSHYNSLNLEYALTL